MPNRSNPIQQHPAPNHSGEQLSTQESSGNHFYQPANNMLNKSIESNSS